MGTFTLDQFRGGLAILPQIRGRTDITNPLLDDWINLAYIECATALGTSSFRAHADISVFRGNSIYNIPSGVSTIVSISDRDSGRILIRSGENSLNKSTSTGAPRFWSQEGPLIHLWPTPDRDTFLRLEVEEEIELLKSPSDRTALHSQWDPAIRFLSKSYALYDLGFSEESVEAFNRYLGYFKSRSNPDPIGGPIEGVNVASSYDDLTYRGTP